MPTNANELLELSRAYVMDCEDRADGLRQVNMHIGEATFPVLLGHNKLPELVAELKKLDFDQVFLGYDDNTMVHCAPRLEAELTKQGISFFRCVMGVTETAKVMSALDDILGTFLKGGGSRKTVVMPVGGGIVANTFGLAAGLLFRGIRLVQCPTTFLNAHDAAASSQKQAINHSGYKNIVGLYHVPTLALVDTSFYETLGATELKAGLGELTKNAALFGGAHYELIRKTTMVKGWRLSGEELCEATFTGLGAKDMLLRHDAREKHLALLFEYGHTVGHALELTEGVHTSHGEGVTVGMLAASFIANRMGIMSDADREAHDALVFALEPEVELPPREIADEVLEKVCHDNKRGYLPERDDFCPFILAQRIGEMHCPNKFYLEYVPVTLVREAIDYVVDYLRAHPKAPNSPCAVKQSLKQSLAPKSPLSIIEGELSRGPTVERCLKDMGEPEPVSKKSAARRSPVGAKNALAQLNAASFEGTSGLLKRPSADDGSCSTTSSTGETEDDGQFLVGEDKAKGLSTAPPLPMKCTTDAEVGLACKLDHPSSQGGCKNGNLQSTCS